MCNCSQSVVWLICVLIIGVPPFERPLFADEVRILKDHQSLVTHVVFSSDSRVLASGACDKKVKLWNVTTGELLRTLEGHDDVVWGVAFSPDGHRLASASWDGTIRIWDVSDGRSIRIISVENDRVKSMEKARVMSVAFAPDGKVLASVVRLGCLQLWNTETWTPSQPPMGFASMFPTVAFDAKGRRLSCSTNVFGDAFWKRDPEGNRFVQEKPLPVHHIHCHAMSPDGRYLARLGRGVEIWDIDKAKLLHTLLGHTDVIHSLAFSSDGKRLVSGADDKSVKVWDVNNATVEMTLTGHTDEVWSVSISPDGRYVASGGRDTTVRLCPVPTQNASPK